MCSACASYRHEDAPGIEVLLAREAVPVLTGETVDGLGKVDEPHWEERVRGSMRARARARARVRGTFLRIWVRVRVGVARVRARVDSW